MTQDLVTISQLSKQFEKGAPLALDSIDTVIPKGKIVGLAGPDGAGKTTLIRLIAGLLLPSSGSITVAGYDTVQEARAIHHLIGYMPQKFGLYEDLTVMQNLVLYADLRGVLGAERRATFERLLDFTGLAPFTDRLAGNLSGGMKQKLGLACSLIRKPALLLLDEPSVGVDPISRRELWKMVQDLLHEDISVLWSTAYLDEAERCDAVLLLNEGKLLYSGPPSGLTSRVEGRTFKVTQISGNRREVLVKALNQSNVIDGVIQGSDVRLVIKEKRSSPFDLSILGAGEQAQIEPTPPRFEDAFVDILGGGPGGESALANEIPRIPPKPGPIIETKDLVKKFGSFTAADHITFDIRSGEIFGLLGPNGAGKSTTFKMMCGLLKPTSGEAFVNGLNLEVAPSQARSHIGYMAQKFSLYGDLSVLQNLNFFSGIYNLKGSRRRTIIQQMVDIFALKPYLDVSAGTLPLGFKQRLALSCAVMHYPTVLFLDEPTSGVDPITRREFWNHINGLVEKGVTVMVTTHFMDEAEYCDRIGLVYRSKLIKVGTPDELKQAAKSSDNPHPTLEDAFIFLIERYEEAQHAQQ
ncbi:ATP-binding cassette domain-containing protein [Candidatus Protochlamydia phocaeensis]|uniref:ATP-binding cassette domain-containing protein n=1 Tax=Candidatus Protochlamydia phocaeensis TaxID=1414722 RepID=UPI0008393356|nr:ATP-binding cassette domain-containing protein [Candidatus Protochlamydia phocaeensis]